MRNVLTRFCSLRSALVAGVIVAVAIPLLVSAAGIAHLKPYVGLDLAQTEIRVRDVFSGHPPLIGLPGRLGTPWVHVGSHPGPISFYALAPIYVLLGSNSWSLLVSSLTLNLFWILIALWIGWRRGRAPILVAVGLISLILVHAFGLQVLLQPWNPYLPLMAWSVVLLAAWSVLVDDMVMLPVLVLAATYCMQTHVSYVGPVAGIVAGVTFIAVGSAFWRHQIDTSANMDRGARAEWLVRSSSSTSPPARGIFAWMAASTFLGGLLWLPPTYEQIHEGNQGNFRIIYESLVSHPPQTAGGFTQGIHQVMYHLNIVPLVTGDTGKFHEVATIWPGAVLLLLWALSFYVAWKARVRQLVMANIVIAFALILAVVAFSRIYGIVWWYLTLWCWTICAMMVAAIAWGGLKVFEEHAFGQMKRPVLARYGSIALIVVYVFFFASLTVSAVRIDAPDRNMSSQMSEVLPPTIEAIRSGKAPGDRGSGIFALTWTDPVNFGSSGYAMLDELLGHGIQTGLKSPFYGIVPRRLIVTPYNERGVIHVAVGRQDIDLWAQNRQAREVAYSDVRNERQRARQRELRRTLADQMKFYGINARMFDQGFAPALETKLPQPISRTLTALEDIGEPVAVFLAPPEQAAH